MAKDNGEWNICFSAFIAPQCKILCFLVKTLGRPLDKIDGYFIPSLLLHAFK